MAIQRRYSKDTYTVARLVDTTTGTDVEYKRGEGSIQPSNLTSMLTTSGATSFLINTDLYTKQPYPVVRDSTQGTESDYYMWADIDYTSRWYMASGWRDWANHGKDSYQQVLGTYDAQALNPLLVRDKDLDFYEIDDLAYSTSSVKRVIDMKMTSVVLPYEPVPPNLGSTTKERYYYRLNGVTDIIKYNSLSDINPDTYLTVKDGDVIRFKYQANTVVQGTGETVLNALEGKYIRYPRFDIHFKDQLHDFDSGGGLRISLQFKADTTRGEKMTVLSGTNIRGNITSVSVLPDNHLEINMPHVYGGDGFVDAPQKVVISTDTILVGEFNNLEILWHDGNGTGMVEFTLNGRRQGIGSLTVGGRNTITSHVYTLGAKNIVSGEQPIADFDGVIKNYQIYVRAWATGVETLVRDYPIDEDAGVIVRDYALDPTIPSWVLDLQGENTYNGTRMNMTDADIDIVTANNRYLLSGLDASDIDLIISPAGKLVTTKSGWIKSIKVDGEVIDEDTYVLPSNNKMVQIEVTSAIDGRLVNFGGDWQSQQHYTGIIADIEVQRGKLNTVWEIKTVGSQKQDPLNGTALSFGIDSVTYDENNWVRLVQ